MRTFTQSRRMQMGAVLALATIMVFIAGPATAAYNQSSNQGQPLTEQQRQDLENQTGQNIDRQSTDQSSTNQTYSNQQTQNQTQRRGRGSSSAAAETRNLQLERQIAGQLRSQGYGQAGQIMILATGNKVILLGNVPDNDTKKGAEQIAKQASSGAKVDDRLHVVSQPTQISDTQLQAKVADKLPGDTAQTIRVQAQNGTVVLQGHVNDWSKAADAIDAAFAAGATQVNSQLTVGTATAQAGGYYPSYGYTPGQQGYTGGGYAPGQQGFGAGARGGQASVSDLRLAHQVAQQLQQQLPPGQNVQTILPQSIYVAVQNGTVTLHGFVRDRNQIQQAEQVARSVQGVQNVNNDIAIFSGRGGMGGQGAYGQAGQGGWQSGTAGGPGQYSQGGAGTQGQYGQGGMSSMGGQGMAGQQGATTDRRLAQNIQQKLQSQFPDANINVRASQGTVILQGSVADINQKQQAEQFAYSIPGVQNVQNNLTVGGQGGTAGQSGYYPPQGYVPGQQSQQGMGSQDGMSSQGQFGTGTPSGGMGAQQATMSRSDLAIAGQVIQKLQQQLQSVRVQAMRPNTIYVIARQGTVTLDGFIRNQSVTQQATQIAKAIPGVQNVQSMLKIMGGAAGGFAPTYGYVPGQTPQGQMGQQGQTTQPGFQGQPGTGMSNQGTNINRSRSGQNTGSAQFSQSAYNQSNMGGRNTGTSSQPGTSGMGAQGMQPMTMSPEDTALAQQVAQKLQQQLSGQKAQVIRMDTIYVMAHQGTVTLYGFITDPSVKQHADQIAQSVSGVNNVKDMLGMTPETGTSSALGYIPGQEDQSENQAFGNDQSGTEGYSIEEFEIIEPGTDESDTGTY